MTNFQNSGYSPLPLSMYYYVQNIESIRKMIVKYCSVTTYDTLDNGLVLVTLFSLSSQNVCDLKQAISSAVSSTAAPGQSPPPDGSTPDNVEKASVPMPNATSDSTAAPLRTSNGSITSHAHSSYSLKYALASDVASVRDGSPIVEGDPAPVRQGIHIEEPKSVAETGGVLGQEGSISVRSSSSSGSSSSSDILGEAKKGEVDTKQEGAGVSASSTEKWDEIGPWAFASEGKDTSKSSTEGVGVSQVIALCNTCWLCWVRRGERPCCVCWPFWTDGAWDRSKHRIPSFPRTVTIVG